MSTIEAVQERKPRRLARTNLSVDAFETDLGWMAILGHGKALHGLSFGHPTRRSAIEALGPDATGVLTAAWNPKLVSRLKDYALGRRVSFGDVDIDWGPVTAFRDRVYRCCRSIRFGETMTYGQLAMLAGAPGAARAVGSCMAANRIPLVVPCHRVVPASGRIGGFSAPEGPAMKERLLRLESLSLPLQADLH